MKIHCYLRTAKRNYIIADEWAKLPELIKKRELDIHSIVMRIVLSQDGSEDLIFEDAMEPLIQNLCLRSLKKLINNEGYSFNYWNYGGAASMVIQGGLVLIKGDLLKETTYPKNELIEAFIVCANAVMDFMNMLHQKYPTYDYSARPYFAQLFEESLADIAKINGHSL